MDKKECFKCRATKPLDAFYAHPDMADGHLGKCKECTKRDNKQWYRRTLDERHAYDRGRCTPERMKRASEHYRETNPQKHGAHVAVYQAIKSGRLIRKPCESCGDPHSEAHHDDYSKPLDVRWLCLPCHRTHHGRYVKAETAKSTF